MERDVSNLPLESGSLPIRVDPKSNGALRIGPTRVTLEVLLTAHLQGNTPEQIVGVPHEKWTRG